MKLEEANKLSTQELLDYGVQKIVEQGGRCKIVTGGIGGCLYGLGGKRCLVGWLLDENDKVLMRFEGDAAQLASAHKEKIPVAVLKNVEIFAIAQNFHDTAFSSVRKSQLAALNERGIDTSAPHWHQWVEMGE